MRKYEKKASSTARWEFGILLAEGLRTFEETAPFAEEVERVNDRLQEARLARHACKEPRLRARARLNAAEYRAEAAIRLFSRSVEVQDGGERRRLFTELFPDGLTPVLSKRGARRLEAIQELVKRLETTEAPGGRELRAAWRARLRAEAQSFAAAVSPFQGARSAAKDARTRERAIGHEHEVVVERTMGKVRAVFPGDRKRQDAVFPEPEDRNGRGREDEDDEAPDDPGPPPGGGP